MRIEIHDLSERLSRGNNLWPFGYCSYALCIHSEGMVIPIPFDKESDLVRVFEKAAELLKEAKNDKAR